MNTNQRKRIYYIPGILTLAIAPILFMARTTKNVNDRTEHCIQTIMIDRYFFQNSFTKIAFQTYQLSGVNKQDSTTLNLIENFARRIRLSNNDSIGLKVILPKNIKYKTYIDLLNACVKSGVNNYNTWGDSVYIYNKAWHPMLCGGGCIQNVEVVNKPTLLQIIKKEKDNILFVSPFIIVYSILLFFAIRKI